MRELSTPPQAYFILTQLISIIITNEWVLSCKTDKGKDVAQLLTAKYVWPLRVQAWGGLEAGDALS